jgi:hypothetical protein
MRRRALSAALLFLSVALSAPATAVPIPWLNCGQPSDRLVITQSDASVWPPPVPAPASATATFDSDGNLVNLRLFLVHGVEWIFDSGPLPTTPTADFIFLPSSFAVSVTSPTLPLAAGPYSTTRTFGTAPSSVTIISHANLGAQVDAPVTTTVSLSSNGTPGFALVPVANGAYKFRVEMTETGGARVFCMQMTVPLKSAAPFVSIENPPGVPVLSHAGMLATAVMLGSAGLLAARRRRNLP